MQSWLKQSGAKGLDSLELADFSATGRGVRTLQSHEEGDRILTIPQDALWTVKHAQADHLLGPALQSTQPSLSVEDTLATYLLFARSRPEPDYDGRRNHVAAMPTSYSSSIFFSGNELEVCAGSSLYAVAKQLEQQIKDDYEDLDARLFGKHRDLFPAEKFTIDDYKWALVTVWSRGMDFALPDGTSIRLLAPFADMLNHSPDVKQCHVYDPSSGDLSILAGKNYKPGDQVFIYYGPVPNNRLLRLYGFVLPDNPNDSYDLVLSTHPLAPLLEQKQKLWARAGLDSPCTVSLSLANPLPIDVFKYLRIQRLKEEDLPRAVLATQGALMSQSIEREVLTSLIESFAALLSGFGATLEVLEQKIADGVYETGSNAWAAAHISIGEQRVLRVSKQKAEELLSMLESGGSPSGGLSPVHQCARCGKSSVPLQLCGRCRAVMYCSRDCQVAHHPEHKATCRAIASRK